MFASIINTAGTWNNLIEEYYFLLIPRAYWGVRAYLEKKITCLSTIQHLPRL